MLPRAPENTQSWQLAGEHIEAANRPDISLSSLRDQTRAEISEYKTYITKWPNAPNADVAKCRLNV